MNKQIQTDIKRYMEGSEKPSEFTMRCFVGMIETGEAIYADFEAACGRELAEAVKSTKEKWDAARSE